MVRIREFRITNTMKLRLAILVCLAALLVPGFSSAQQEADAPSIAATKPGEADTAELTTRVEEDPVAALQDISAAISSGKAEVASDSSLDTTLRSSLDQLYQSAQQSVQAATTSQKNVSQYAAMSKDAKNDLMQLNAELQKPQPAKVEIQPDEGSNAIAQRLAAANAELTEATGKLESLAGEPLRRQQRLAEIPGQLAEAQKSLSDMTQQLALAPPLNERPVETHARVASLRARAAAAKARIDELQQEQIAYTSTSDVMPLRKTLANQRVDQLRADIDTLQMAFTARQQSEVRDTTLALREDLVKVSSPLQSLAQANIELSQQHQELIGEAATATQTFNDIKEATQNTQAELKTTRERVKAVGLTDALGLMLRTRRTEYEQLRQRYLPHADLKERIQSRQVVSFQLEDELSEIDDLIQAAKGAGNSDVVETLSSAGSTAESSDGAVPDRLSLLIKRKELLAATLQSQNTLLQALLNGDTQRRLLLQQIDLYINFIDEQVFWIRNAPPFSVRELQYAPAAAQWLMRPAQWIRVGHKAIETVMRHPLNCLLAAIAIAVLLSLRPRLKQTVANAAVEGRRYSATLRPTVQTLMATCLLAGVWPSIFLLAGCLLIDRVSADPFVDSVGAGLIGIALFVVPRTLLREACCDDGLGDAHFGWSLALRSTLRFHLWWYMWLGSLLIFLLVLWHANPDKDVRSMTERLTSVCLFASLAVFNYFIFQPRSPLFVQIVNSRPDSTLYHIRRYIWAAMLGIPIVLVVMSLAGYLDTAFRLAKSIQFSLILLVVVVLAVALVFRWLSLRYRDIAMKQAREKREKLRAAAEASDTDSLSEEVGIDLVEDESTDLPTLDRQTRQTVSTLSTVLSLIALAMIWSDVLPALDVLDRVQIGSMGTGEKIRLYTLKDIFFISAAIAATIYAIRTIPGVLEMIVLQRSSLDSGARYAWTTIVRYILIIAGAVIVMNMLSIPYQQLGWLLAAASVGLGFGMQEIFANFVSGIILLLERPVRVGDVVTIGETTGVVSRIQMRATTVTSWDRKELVVPNKDLITEKLLNWSLSNVINRVTINVGVDYTADPDEVRTILERVVKLHPDVMSDPAPMVNLEQFGDNSLDYSVRFFLANLDRRVGVTHEINSSILRALRIAKINIPFPQRDLRIRVEHDATALPIELRRESNDEPRGL